jgi:hypothetical protein
MGRLARALGVAALLAGAAWSCASVLDVDHDYFVRGDAAGVDGAQAGDVGTSPDGSKDATQPGETSAPPADGQVDDVGADAGLDSSSPPPPVDSGPPCALQTVDSSQGVFVTTYGMDNSTCAIGTPCLTVQAAIQAARVNGMPTVYIANGLYTESVQLFPGVTLMGGWNALGPTWTPVCSGNRSSVVTIQAPASSTQATIVANNLIGLATISTLTVKSVDQSAVMPGQSLYGIAATGGMTQVALLNVDVVMANAGNGVAGAAGDAGGNSCGAEGSEDAGADGGPSGMAGMPSDGGTYAATGYTPGAGAVGSPGGNGVDGMLVAGPTCSPCITSCVCGPSCSLCEATPGSSCGTPATPSCAGVGGQGGLGGAGGGSSIALFAWDAMVSVSGGSLSAGTGGAGGNGGVGGTGGAAEGANTGSPGQVCGTSCLHVGPGCETAGAAHGAGGSVGASTPGGAGGQGGGGAGGSSFAVYVGGAGRITGLPTVTVTVGTPGPGGMPSGANGVAQPQGP